MTQCVQWFDAPTSEGWWCVRTKDNTTNVYYVYCNSAGVLRVCRADGCYASPQKGKWARIELPVLDEYADCTKFGTKAVIKAVQFEYLMTIESFVSKCRKVFGHEYAIDYREDRGVLVVKGSEWTDTYHIMHHQWLVAHGKGACQVVSDDLFRAVYSPLE